MDAGKDPYKTHGLKKLHNKLGILFGLISIGMGIISYFTAQYFSKEQTVMDFLNYAAYIAAGFFVLIVTLHGLKNAGSRYYSKQFQTMLLYLMGSLDLLHTGEMRAVILFVIGVALAYRYSRLKAFMVIGTAAFNGLLLIIYARANDLHFIDILDRLLFLLFIYSVIYLIYKDYYDIMRRRFMRMNRELGFARAITPFGEELKKRLAESEETDVEFTKKEYEVMVAMCFYEELSNEELSKFMNISIATVKSHLNNIYKKTGIHNRSRLIAVYKNVFVEKQKIPESKG
ncbi:MAG TPA: hypothetical protein DCO79_11170 [Spirochaeta sp.]|nr:hypothetical protein [Spirochaeta sp.]